MRKRVIAPPRQSEPHDKDWLPLQELADVEVTSESSDHPIEDALMADDRPGWRASAPGKQTIRLLFPRPQRVKRIWLSFIEPDVERTQEYVVRWSPDNGQSFRDVVRQQWNFNPGGATVEAEDHHVELSGVTILELAITPDTRGGAARASLHRLRVG